MEKNAEKKIRPQDKWNEKVGLVSKSYKLKKDLIEEFAITCKRVGVSQAGQLSILMKKFIEENRE